MKKANSIIIATIIATFVISMFAFQPTKTEASNNILPLATPSPRKVITKRKTSTKVWEHSNIPSSNAKIKPKKPTSFTEVSGLSVETQRRKHPRRKSSQYNPKEVGIDKIKARKSKSSIIFDDTDGAEKVTRKKPKGIMQDYYPHSNIRSKTTRKASKSEVSMESVERRKRPRKTKH